MPAQLARVKSQVLPPLLFFFSGYSIKDIEDLLSKARFLGKGRRTFLDWGIYRHEEGASDLFYQLESLLFKQVSKSSFQ